MKIVKCEKRQKGQKVNFETPCIMRLRMLINDAYATLPTKYDSSVSTMNRARVSEDEDSVDCSNHVETRWYEAGSDPSDHSTGVVLQGPSPSIISDNTSSLNR